MMSFYYMRTIITLTIDHDEEMSSISIRETIADKLNKLPVGGRIKEIHLSLPGMAGLSLDFEA